MIVHLRLDMCTADARCVWAGFLRLCVCVSYVGKGCAFLSVRVSVVHLCRCRIDFAWYTCLSRWYTLGENEGVGRYKMACGDADAF